MPSLSRKRGSGKQKAIPDAGSGSGSGIPSKLQFMAQIKAVLSNVVYVHGPSNSETRGGPPLAADMMCENFTSELDHYYSDLPDDVVDEKYGEKVAELKQHAEKVIPRHTSDAFGKFVTVTF